LGLKNEGCTFVFFSQNCWTIIDDCINQHKSNEDGFTHTLHICETIFTCMVLAQTFFYAGQLGEAFHGCIRVSMLFYLVVASAQSNL
jgi:hypothetical protein